MEVDVQENDPVREGILAQVEKIRSSSPLAGSETLRNLLQYLALHALDSPGRQIRECDLAREVFGRRPDAFDPRTDSVVRVHVGRLRSKLIEYYSLHGAADPVVLEIPKGAYTLTFRPRPVPEPPPEKPGDDVPPDVPETGSGLRLWRRRSELARYGIALAAGVVLCLAAMLSWRTLGSSIPRELETFWRPFVEAGRGPIVVYSSPKAVGTLADGGLRYFEPGIDPEDPAIINDTYTGVGDVMAVHSLTLLFGRLQAPIRVKRGQLLSWDEARAADIVFIGFPEQNLPLRELPKLMEFNFRRGGFIINEHPGPGEPSRYNSSGRPWTRDYAIVAKVPSFYANRRVLILAGTSTYGNQAAAEFVCSPMSLGELISRLGASATGPLPDFEALLEVKIAGGVPVQSKLLHARLRGK